MLSYEVVQDPRAAAALDLADDVSTLSFARLRSVGDTPLALMRNWLPPAYLDIGRDELETTGLYDALRARGAKPVVARQEIGARMPTPAERRALGIRGSQPVLTMTRTAFDVSGTAVEFSDHVYRAEDYTLEMVIDER